MEDFYLTKGDSDFISDDVLGGSIADVPYMPAPRPVTIPAKGPQHVCYLCNDSKPSKVSRWAKKRGLKYSTRDDLINLASEVIFRQPMLARPTAAMMRTKCGMAHWFDLNWKDIKPFLPNRDRFNEIISKKNLPIRIQRPCDIAAKHSYF